VTAQLEYVYPPVTDDLLVEMVRRIRQVDDPIKIVLFGSRARGDARPDSDIDILRTYAVGGLCGTMQP
jgi:predicted nucleotidyltransferase